MIIHLTLKTKLRPRQYECKPGIEASHIITDRQYLWIRSIFLQES